MPNKFTRWYVNDLGKGSEFLSADWCDIFIAWVAEQAGVRKQVGTFAYTPDHANWFASKGRWGTTPKRGAIVFFDWQGGKARSGIDHVGIVYQVNRDGTITTIEGNNMNRVVKKTRSSSSLIVGYGYWF